MPEIGQTISHYRILEKIGQGGMGEVYQANDQKLGRNVAIKVLPEEFAKDANRVARFQREAKLLASLNHPNIAAIYGLEEYTGTHFLVLELIEGDTLADRIKAGSIPVEEALKLALQISEALEAAHEKGVIHRDLKPANIKVTPDGKVKVLDFGLAKAFAGEQSDLNMSNSPTLSDMATQQGVILGTAAYMSPEQARGKEVDKRADIWAFGVVLFETLTGQPLFAGGDVTSTLARVLEREPDFSTLPVNLHPKIIEMLERCLEKDPKDRYSGINDARVDIQKVLADPGGVFARSIVTKPRKKLRLGLPWVAAAIFVTAVIIGVAVWILKPTPPSEPKQIISFDYDLPEGQQFTCTSFPRSNIAISHDGRQLAYATPKGLYLRSLDQLSATLITGTEENVEQPFFSPDGQSIGYFSITEKQLKRIAINGGVPVPICPCPTQVVGICWEEDNTIVYGQYPGDIMRVSAIGGTPELIIKAISAASIFPHILPGGKSVLYTNSTDPAQGNVIVQSLGSGKPKELFTGFAVGYLPTGHIVYGLPDKDNLYAIPFDPNAMEVKGGPVAILEGVMQHGVNAAISDSGTLVYIPGTGATTNLRDFIWVDREGNEEPLSAEPQDYFDYFKISPDGMQTVFTINKNGNYDIWIRDLVRETSTRLTRDSALDFIPIWTPDSNWIIFSSIREHQRYGIYRKAADGSGKVEKLVSAPARDIYPLSLTNKGKTLILVESGGESGYDIGILSMEGEYTPKLLLHEKYDEKSPQISPDGKWLAYQSNESGKWEIYLRPFTDMTSGGWKQVSIEGGEGPVWSPDGDELYYRTPDAIMAVSVETEPTIKLGKPIPLFPNKYVGEFDIHPHTKRFLMLKPHEAADGESTEDISPKIIIITNWFEELKQKLPVK